MRSRSGESRTEHYVCLPGENRTSEHTVFVRIIFKVGVLHDNEWRRNFCKACAQSCPFALVYIMTEEFDARVLRSHWLQTFPGIILRSIINNNDLYNELLL